MSKKPNDNRLLDRFKDINPKEINWFIYRWGQEISMHCKY